MATLYSGTHYTFDDVLLRPQYSEVSSRDNVDISTEIVPGIKLKTPIMSANMQTVNSVELAVALAQEGGMATVDQFRSIENQVSFIVEVKKHNVLLAASIGVTKDFMDRAVACIEAKADIIIIDTPHAHNQLTKDAIKLFRSKYKDFPLIVGNIATREAAMFLLHQDVDGIKVGIGPGGACLTRVNAGCGAPQISALFECFDIVRNHGVSIIADGGIKAPGSFAKAIAAGGSACYMGSIFAGTNEAPSKLVEVNGVKYKEYYGSSSEVAKIKRSIDDPSFKEKSNRYVEGGSGYTTYQGSVAELVERYVMGLKSAMSYTGAFTISEFWERAVFTLITQNGVIENGIHSIVSK